VPSTNTFTEWPVPTSASVPIGVAVASSGNVYFTEYDANIIGSLS
jgi:streptogramin lyase